MNLRRSLLMLVMMAALTLLSAPEVRAGRRHDGRRCKRDAQCLSGTCCNGRCSPQSASCITGQAKPPASEKCTGKGTFCGACGVCIKGRCTGGETGRCSACKVCSQDGSACIGVPDGSAVANEYYGCGPDAHGGLWCCGGNCADTLSNIDNCGACGNACTGGKLCREIAIGVVGCACRDSETECNGTCANLQTDPNNCGQCGHACASGGCDNGVCSCLSWCDGSGNCGGGQADCGPCETCNNGACVPTCGGGQICCGGGCVDTQTDPSNCGGCGHVCPNSGTCQDGACTACPYIPDHVYHYCPVNLGGDITGYCCDPDTPTCCFTDLGGSCCRTDSTCCDGYCCPADTQCCVNSRHTYPCLPAGQQCTG